MNATPRTLSVLVPVYNEKATVAQLLAAVQASPISIAIEIVVVDDGSTDGTREILRALERPGLRVFFQEKNRGKGAAIRRALLEATGEFAIIQDADLEYDPLDYPGMIKPLLDGRADVVYGSRFLGGPHRVLLFWHYFGNLLFTLITNVLYDINLTDMGTCYKAFRREIVAAIPLSSERFGIEAELTAKFCKRRLRIFEVPISYSGRTYAEGKKITWKDGFSYLWALLRYRFAD
jgi:glycosyltransferase involved in cell wall biosynthesis